MEYEKIKEEYQKRFSKITDNVGLFWAFNREQLAEGMKKNPSEKYVNIGMGGFMPKVNVDQFMEKTKALDAWFKEEKKKIKKEKMILYELNNYECFYTGDIQDAYEVLADTCSFDEVNVVYKKYKAAKYRTK